MGDFLMNDNINFINVLYQNAEMGIIGINDITSHITNNKLRKEINREKKEYQNIVNACKKLMKKEKNECKSISIMAKMSSSMYSEMKLLKDDSDQIIIKMMIEGTYKSIGILTTKEMEYKNIANEVKKLNNKFILTLMDNVNNLKNIMKLYK